MISTVASWELRRLYRDRRVVGLAATLVLLALVVGGMGWTREQGARTEVRQALEANRRDWVEQGEKSPHAAAHYGQVLARPRSPLVFLVPGVDPFTGVTLRLEAHARHVPAARPAGEDTGLGRFGLLSPALLVEVLAPLVLVLLGFATVAGDRENGTLRQLLATGASPGSLVAGKTLGLLLAGIGTAVLPFLGLVVLSLATGDSGGDLLRSGLLILAWGLYLLTWMVVTVAVSAWSRRSHVALVTLVGLWLLTVVMAPRVASEWGRHRAPPESPVARARELEAQTREGRKERKKAYLAEVLERYSVGSKEELPVNFDALWLQAMEEYDNALFDQDLGRLRGRFQVHDRTAGIWSWVSPTLAVQRLARAAAGTDRLHMEHFSDAAEGYRRQIVEALNRAMAEGSRTGDWKYQTGKELWSSLPPFEYHPPSAREALAPRLPEALALLAWLLVSAGGLVQASRRLRGGGEVGR